MGKLYPIFVDEAFPGDYMRLNAASMIRLAPMLAPIMHAVNIYTYFFKVPIRLIWDDFEDFITGGKNGTLQPVVPRVTFNQLAVNQEMFAPRSLADYMSLPVAKKTQTVASTSKPLVALPFRAYQLIWNEYFRDQNLQDEIVFSHGSGVSTTSDQALIMAMRRKCWGKDYFTSALPWAQRGNPVTLPLSGDAQIVATDPTKGRFVSADGQPISDGSVLYNSADGKTGTLKAQDAAGGNERDISYDPNGSLDVDLSGVSATTINDLRHAISLQQWLENNARGGARYIEQIAAHFGGVRSSDARLQRPEFLGGGRSPMVISEVLQTSESQNTPQGTMAGHGLGLNVAHQFRSFFEEHCIVMGLMCVLPKTAYQQGIPRMFSRFDKFDYAWPEMAHLGEQEVLNQELYFDPLDSADTYNSGTFGYQSRFAEYKWKPSTVHGEFRDSLAFWHMGRIFNDRPNLNAKFVESDPTTRIFAVEDENIVDHMYAQVEFDYRVLRMLPRYGTPGLLRL